MGTECVASGALPFGTSFDECSRLLNQTEEASKVSDHLDLSGIYDLRPALTSSSTTNSNGQEVYLSARQLEGIASSLTLLLKAKALVQPYPELYLLSEGIDQASCSRVIRAVNDCISKGYVKDEASEALKEARSKRAENRETLKKVLEEQAALAFSKGASDSRGNTAVVRGRVCIGIKAGRSGDLPRGSVKLSQSQSGQTFYYEPAPAIALNNAAMELEEKEKREEVAILLALTRLVSSSSDKLFQSLEAASSLDIAKARALHGVWCGGIKPSLLPPCITPGASALHIPNALHPLLLELSLPPLPDPPSFDDNRFDQGFGSAGDWEMKRRIVEKGRAGGEGSRPSPKPLDLRVPPSISVVAITGPNTGGKTVALKTAGLAVLFSKSGLFVPVQVRYNFNMRILKL